MSREIEFRGLPISGGSFVYGSLIETTPNNVDGNHTAWIKPKCRLGLGALSTPTESFVMVKTETASQFTGLLDCNGVKIFEGDILKMWYAPRSTANCQVIFNDGCFFLDVKNATPKSCLIKDVEINGNTLTVIGNIHQNSELLK